MMPHEQPAFSAVTGASTGAVDHRQALRISVGRKLDNGQIGNPLKILKRKGLFNERTSEDMAKSTKKHPKIHWSQLASRRASHHHNGKQADSHEQNDSAMLDIKRREVKVILMDVLQTEVGQRYLHRCGSNPNAKTQTPFKRRPSERLSERGPSTECSAVRRRASTPCKDQSVFSPLSLASFPSSKTTDSVCATKNDVHLSKEAQSLADRRCKRLKVSQKHAGHTMSDESESCLVDKSDSLPSKESHLLPKHTESPDTAKKHLCSVEENDSESVSPPHSAGAVSEQNSKSLVTPTHTLSQVIQPSSFRRTEYQDSETEAVPTQQNTSKNEAQECVEVIEQKDGEFEQERQKEEEPLHQNREILDEGGGARGSILYLPTGATEGQLSEGEVTSKFSQITGSADEHTLDPELVEVRQASKPQSTEPIVLSSEEELEEDGTSHVQALEGANEPHRQQKPIQTIDRRNVPDAHIHPFDMNSQGSSFDASPLSGCPVMELQFSALYMGNLSTLTNGLIKITDDRITISFKDQSDCEVKVSLMTSHVLKYSMWDQLLLQDTCLAKENEAPPPSILLLWLAEVQARHLYRDLSVLQSGACLAEGSACVVLCMSEPLSGVHGALLASIMDIVGLRYGNRDLLSPLTHPDSVKILQNPQDSYILQLLLPKTETPTVSCESVTSNSAKTKDSDALSDCGVYTVCQSRGQSSYSVSMVHNPGADWTPYQHCGPARRLIQFPPPPSKGAITVTTEDLECLDSGEFLNDVIIDFYLKYLLVQKAPHASVKRSHIFSSFFYKQLTRRDNANEDSTSTPSQLRRHQRVRTWTRHVDIFEKDFLFVPVNQEAHWYLVVVCFPGLDEPQYVQRGDNTSVDDWTENSMDATPQSDNQLGNGDVNSDENSSRSVSALGPPTCTESTCEHQTVCKRPCILIMDSLKLSVHERIFKLLREYLQAEWEVKRGGHRDFSSERMIGSHCRVPLQDNSSDCGLYLLQYAESFLQDPVVHFDLPLKLESWFPRQKIREKREEIRDLVLHLYRFQQGSLENDISDNSKELGNVV